MPTIPHLKVIHRRAAAVKPEIAQLDSKKFRTSSTSLKALVKQVHNTNCATMPKAVRKAMLADLEAHYLHNNEERSTFDPSGLPEFALAKCPGHPWLADALRACTEQWAKNEMYSNFIDPATRAKAWNFHSTMLLDCPPRGGLAIDILKDRRIGGIEFSDAVMGRPTSAEAMEQAIRALAPIHQNK